MKTTSIHHQPDRHRIYFPALLFLGLLWIFSPGNLSARGKSFTMKQVLSFPFPSGMTVAATGSHVAWTINFNGLRNIYVAEGPEFTPRRLTPYLEDEGQELSSVKLSADGKWCVYIRGGDFGANWDDALPVNPRHLPEPPKVQIWSIPFSGGDPILLGEGTSPVISPLSDSVIFVRKGQLWGVPIDGSSKPGQLFNARGRNGYPRWSPDGKKLAFRSYRNDHAFIGIFSGQDKPIVWLDPAFTYDNIPRWSPDSKKVAFVRMAGEGGAPDSILSPEPNPWKILTADIRTGNARIVWKSPDTPEGSYPTTQGRSNLHWGAGRIVFLSYQDGWPHLYSIPENGGKALLLTPGNFMAEYISISADGKQLVFAGNTGPDPLDLERRHIVRVSVDKADMEIITPGTGLEWTPFITGDGKSMIYISATAKRPPLPAVMNLADHKTSLLGADLIPEDYPTKSLITPTQVIFNAPDGTEVHADLFVPKGGTKKKPAVIFVHGGPPRQMLLGWHYSSYYSNAYAVNQYLVNKGFVVLSVNYRLGIGYGYHFHHPKHAGPRGASEYQDIKAAGEWLATQPFVDGSRIGIYGGSYGGYLTAMALARNSDIFAAGVDISGVHDRSMGRVQNYLYPHRYEKAPDAEKAARVTWLSSPNAYVKTWTSPVLIIHADDDRNVNFVHSTDLVQRLLKRNVPMETLTIVDDTHHFLLHSNQVLVDESTADFLIRHLLKDER
ncbi:MAG: prolyl oligopeptidase family serine peptidase [Chlorobi bacterium]|nr:prolyl oligopeptidase family serine peptidase [Chlorobiota bacterium]